jgi:hypothetical protein
MNPTTQLSNAVGACTVNKAPTILTSMGLCLGAATVYFAVKKTPEANKRREKAVSEALKRGDSKPVVIWKAFKAMAPVYALPMVTGVLAGACIIGSDIIVNKRLTKTTGELATVTAGYLALQDKFTNYKKTAEEVLGESKKKDLDRKAIERQMENSKADENNPITPNYRDDGDKQLCYDVWSDRYFRASVDDLRKAENKVNLMLFANDEVTLNDWYSEIGLPTINSAEGWGWTARKCALKGGIDLDIGCCMSPNNTPCASVDFSSVIPLWDTRK